MNSFSACPCVSFLRPRFFHAKCLHAVMLTNTFSGLLRSWPFILHVMTTKHFWHPYPSTWSFMWLGNVSLTDTSHSSGYSSKCTTWFGGIFIETFSFAQHTMSMWSTHTGARKHVEIDLKVLAQHLQARPTAVALKLSHERGFKECNSGTE